MPTSYLPILLFHDFFVIYLHYTLQILYKKMAKFVPCIRNKRSDDLYPVYIRVFHNSSLQYINTGLLVGEKGLKTTYDKNGKKQIGVSDRRVLGECLNRISNYAEKMNLINAKELDCKSLIELLTNDATDLSFSEYANTFLIEMYNQNRENPARNYKLAVSSLHNYLNKTEILFKHLTSKVIGEWIESMKDSARKKSLYPSCIRSIFNSAIKKYNDYDYDIIRIRTNPFARVKIPKESVPEKRSIDVDIINKVLTSKIEYPNNYNGISRKEMGRDVGLMIFCLAGINAADLYDMKKEALKDWKLCYNRKKTREKSDTGAYMEITIPELIRPLFEKYKGSKRLFLFSERFTDSTGFVKNVNKGLKAVCEEIWIEETITTYTFRHSWATIAQNHCGASTELIAFSLNHSSAHKVTEGYIRKDYTPIDQLNEQVINHVLKHTINP